MSEHIEVKGEVVDVERNGFRVKLEDSEQTIFARLSGKMRQHRIRILLGDIVSIKVSPFDLTHGILVRRH